ncbi:acyltransferase [Xanthobacter sp. VTT E-85241]|uniref:acyltransferase family protein n=1 Tax=Roseixanthobacter finlandensis TaxID=3119922 RepID=UPI00372B4E0D
MVRFKALDAWRGICALLVVLFHFCFVFRSPLMGTPIVTNAFLFVDFFFVLSGFVVCHAYRDRLGDAPSWRAFVVRRFGRLWPLHAAMLALFIAFITLVNLLPHPERFAFTLGPSEYSAIAIPIHLLLLNAVDLHGMAWNAPSWSIGAEFYTYLLFGAVCVLTLRRLSLAAAALVLASIALLAMVAPSYMNSTADFGLFRCVAGFFTGVVAYRLHELWGHRRLPLATAWEAGIVALVALFVIRASHGPDAVRALSLAAPLAFAAAVLVFAREQGAISRLLRARPFAALGRWSYSIYMSHQLVLMAAAFLAWSLAGAAGVALEREVMVEGHAKTLYDLGGVWQSHAALAGVLLVVLALSALTYSRIEEPARLAFNAFAKRMVRGEAVRRAFAQVRARRVSNMT